MAVQTLLVTGIDFLDSTGLPTGASVGVGDSDTGLPAPPAGAAAAGPLRVGQSFGPRYHIIKVLGVGGMGAVYQAWDAELSVAVALKVIRLDPQQRGAASEAEKRFKNELLLARQVTHKNVVRIHDLGEIDGIKYITMPYVQGEDLATTLRRDGALAVPLALRIARQIAAGLEAAHDAGIVHRDLKPANVMITMTGEEVHAQIMDFGISASTSEALAGGLMGTLEYMAPEQGTGSAVDARADIYAFGLILYEMLAGPWPLADRSLQSRIDRMKQRCRDGIPALRTVAPAVPLALETLVGRCVAIEPDARFATTHDLCTALAALDDNGEPIPEARHLTPRLTAAIIALVVLLLGGTYFVAQRKAQPAKVHDPVSVVIADFQNTTKDATFDRTLEPMLRRALEGASFISAYDRNGITRTLGVRPPERLDAVAAREVAVKQGIGVVLSGSIDSQGSGYRITMNAAQTVTGKVVATAQGTAGSKEEVLPVATRLVSTVRTALGDATSESSQIFAMASLSATSLDVVRHYAAAQEAASNNNFDVARDEALKAIQADPKFGIGYQLLAVASRNVGNVQDSEKYINEALRYIDGMTERERYSTRGFYYRITGDYQQCVKEYGDLIARYAADVVGHNQLALCLTQLRDMKRAVAEMRQVVRILPNRVLFRDNLALYANYAGDFAAAEAEARTVQEPDVYASVALAFAQLGQGQVTQAAATYGQLAGINALAASMAASGRGDVAALQGRFAEAVSILRRGAIEDMTAGNTDRAAAKLVAISYAELSRGNKRAALAAARQALANSKAVKIRFLAGRSFLEAGDAAAAQPLMAGLSSELQAEPQAYGKLLAGEAALLAGDAREAIKTLVEANALLDTWIGHFDLGRAYLAARALPQADSEFDRCLARRGEALSLFLDEEPTYAYLPAVYYYQGLVREGLKTAGFAESFRAYLSFRGGSTDDPLVADVRRRAGA